jgi:hypothetical protein
MQFDWMSSVIGFLVGATTTATGAYFAAKFTDQRRENESAKQLKRVFLNIKKQMPELIAEFKTDLAGSKLTREFFVLTNKKDHLGGSQKHRFVYYEEEHKNLRGKLDLLENEGFLVDMTPGNTPVYRMTEEFVDLINKYG